MVDEGRELVREGDAVMGGIVCGWSCVYLVGTYGWVKFVILGWEGGGGEGCRGGVGRMGGGGGLMGVCR